MTEERTILAPEIKMEPKLYIICQAHVSECMLKKHQTMGRPSQSTTPDIAIGQDFVSRKHGEFVTNDNGTYYRDMESMNGTWKNGELLKAKSAVLLENGDVLKIKEKDNLNSDRDVCMIYTTDYCNATWEVLDLSEAKAVNIGRDEQLRLNSKAVSRKHASFFLSANGWAIIDHESMNGVYRNGRRITHPEYLEKNDIIRIANYYFIFQDDKLLFQHDTENMIIEDQETVDSEPANLNENGLDVPKRDGKPALCINIVERSVWKRIRKKMLLKDIKIDIPLGSMVLILGGSGAGKTTFMNAVMGYEQAEGTIKYNDTDIYEEFERMQYEIGYVPQQDLMRPNDIAFDTVLNAAQLKLEPGMPEPYYAQQAEKAMDALGLADEKNQLVRSLSGGQRKRLSIAMEYVGNPSLFFLDEPDSGVDNTNSELLLKNLRMIADEGKIVMFISHSPDRTIEMIDKIIVLAKDSENDCGRLVFYGNPYKALVFFDVENLNKIVTRINKKNEGGDGLADEYIEKFMKEGHLYG